MYNDTVIEHFNKPQNVGEIQNCDAAGKVSSEFCGDMIFLYLAVAGGVIQDAKAKTFGCAAAVASASMLSTLLIGRTLEEAKQITSEQIVESLGGLPDAKIIVPLWRQRPWSRR